MPETLAACLAGAQGLHLLLVLQMPPDAHQTACPLRIHLACCDFSALTFPAELA